MPYSINELKSEYNHISISEAPPEVKNAIEKLKTEKVNEDPTTWHAESNPAS